MKVLAVQSAVAQGSVALYDEPTGFARSMDMPLTGRLSTALAPAINELLEDTGWAYTDIGLYACALGPGSFTGLRVGMALGKGLSLAVGCAIKAVSTLDIIRYNYEGEGRIIAVIDARSDRVYYAVYDAPTDNAYLTNSEPKLASVKDLLKVFTDVRYVIGPDADLLGAIFKDTDVEIATVVPDALTLAKIARARFSVEGGDETGTVAPIYLKSGQV